MPAKRNPKKKPRTPSPKPTLAELTPPDLDALTVAPEQPGAGSTPPPAPKAGPPPRRGAGFAGRGRPAASGRQYVFRRS
ncbi:hypothetical protein O7606_26770 [Micromonospora sp. WMMD882]|uniref:hypothetical protein n=1 Tax=Micromonospora sp. WMMD882 TaxID=3015151 RepID=UPI00248B226D|nr:hypothetical protein [Micromonospora sp. WMMD882]WBB79695.1 hypothetical protein O7606_26770 [Micromonospora sp. WMMD882]